MPDDVPDKPSDGRAKNGNHDNSRKNLRPGSPAGGYPGAGRHGVQMPQKKRIGEALKVLLGESDPATGQSYAVSVAMAMIQTATSATSRHAVAAAIFIRDTTEGPPKKRAEISAPNGSFVEAEDARAKLIAKLIFHQQYQMARFIHTYYPDSPIAINDIGAICFYSDPYLTDLVGLGDTEVIRARIADHALWTEGWPPYGQSGAVQAVLGKRSPEIALVYDDWFGFDKTPPPGWYRTGVWTLPVSTAVGGKVVSFYGVGWDNAMRLRANLVAFHQELPEELAPYSIP